MLLSNDTTLGLDLGTTGLRAVEATWSNGRPIIQRWAMLDFTEPVTDWRSADPDEIAGHIRAAMQERRLRGRWAAHSVGGEAVAPQYFNFPQLLPEDIADAVRIEVETALPFPAEGAAISHLLFPDQRLSSDKVRTHGLAIAAEGEFVESRLLAIRQAGLETFYLETDATACANAYVVSRHAARARGAGEDVGARTDVLTPGHQTTAILNIGHRYTNLALLGAEGTLLLRDIPWGGGPLTAAIAESLAVPLDEAERLKRAHWKEETGAAPATAERLLEVLDESADDCLARLRDTVQYWVGERLVPGLGGVLLTGGGSQVRGLKEMLANAFEVPVEHWTPALEFAGERAEAMRPEAARLTVAFGLALRELFSRKS